jgi:hypothetical protein
MIPLTTMAQNVAIWGHLSGRPVAILVEGTFFSEQRTYFAMAITLVLPVNNLDIRFMTNFIEAAELKYSLIITQRSVSNPPFYQSTYTKAEIYISLEKHTESRC